MVDYLRRFIKFSLLIFLIISIITCAVLLLFIGFNNVLAIGLLSGIVGSATMVVLVIIYDLFLRFCVFVKYGIFSLEMSASSYIKVDCQYLEEAFDKLNTLNNGFIICERNQNKSITLDTRGINPSLSERVVVIAEIEKSTKTALLRIKSYPKNKLAIVDGGKNLKNVCLLKKLLIPYCLN